MTPLTRARLKIGVCITIAAIAFVAGGSISYATGDDSWLPRSGSLVVVIALGMTLVEFKHRMYREPRATELGMTTEQLSSPEHQRDKMRLAASHQAKVRAVKSRFLYAEFGLGMVGTIVWGFGDLLF